MKRREYLTGVAGVGALTAAGVGSVSASTASNHVVGSIPDPEGDDDGPGGYAYPTASEFVEGAYDMTGVTIYDNGDSWTFEVGIAGDFTNSYEFAGGFGVQVLELYIRDPDAGSDVPTSTQGRPGTGVTFEGPWHYLVHVMGDQQLVEDASSEAGAFDTELGEPNVLANSEEGDAISASGDTDANTISFTVNKDVIGGGNIEDKEIAMLMFGQDGFGLGGIRTSVGVEAAEYQIGLGDNPVLNNPKAFDMLDPEGVVDQYEALSYTEDEAATVPLFRVGDAIESGGGGDSGDGGDGGGFSLPATAQDPTGDDDGPGGYAYPTASEFVDGAYDMTDVTVMDDGDSLTFEVGIAGDFTNSYEFAGGFGVQVIELYIQDPNAGSDVPTSTQGRPGTGVTFEEPWHYLVHVMGDQQLVEDASSEAGAFDTELGEPNVLANSEEGDAISASGDTDANTISFTVNKDVIGGGNIEDKEIAMLMFGQDGFGLGGIRTSVGVEAAEYQIGLGDNPVLNNPKAFDMLDPEGVVDQYEALSYTEDEAATVPLFAMSEGFTPAESGGGGEEEAVDSDGDGVPDDEDYAPEDPTIQDPPAGPDGQPDQIVPGGEGTPTSIDRDGFTEDVDGDGDVDSRDVSLLFDKRNSDAVQSNSAYYDFNDDGQFTIGDIVELYNKIFR